MERLKPSGIEHLEPSGIVKTADLVTASNIRLRRILASGLFGVFTLAVFATYALIFLWGFKKIDLPQPFVHWLGAATVGQTSGLLLLIVKDLFPSRAHRRGGSDSK